MNELEKIEGIGPKTASLLNKLGIYDKNDLLSHYPFRYEVLKRSDVSSLNNGDKIIIDGIIEGQPTNIFITRKLTKMIFRINTKTNIINVTVYNRPFLKEQLKSGVNVIVIGKYDRVKNAIIASDIRIDKLPEIPKIEPIYYTTSGLSKKLIAKYISNVIEEDYECIDLIPDYLQEKYQFTNKQTAIKEVHNPFDILSLKKARQRLKYEELFTYLLKINYLKSKIKEDNNAISRKINSKKIEAFIKTLPYTLTEDQTTSLQEILTDLEAPKRMNRLLQGDVGSGKTIIAFLASYANYLSGYQTALMVPTEILAKQHYEEAIKLFEKEDIKIELITSSTTKKDKESIYNKLENNEIDLIIGTQSLIQEKIKYNNLGLVITDEQHRFGVNQRNTFKNKGVSPDVLSMSATPIPRTYALTIYGDMDISSIKTKPLGRKEVITTVKKEKDILEVLTKMQEELEQKHQIYVIAPMIEDDEKDDIENVIELTEKMTKAFGKKYKIGTVHGKLEAQEKNKIMKNFETGKIDILVSTTVIEVGVNVPNASMIVIFNSNLFGLSTLHQLRGRVGRSDIQSYCILISKDIQDRLRLLEKTNDGFEISEYDFVNRGEGDLFGVKQSGDTGLILANINKDFKMLTRAKEDADEFIKILFQEKDKYQHIIKELQKIENLD